MYCSFARPKSERGGSEEFIEHNNAAYRVLAAKKRHGETQFAECSDDDDRHHRRRAN